VSLATAPPSAEQTRGATWTPALWRQEARELAGKPWYASYRVQSAGLLALTAAVVAWWW
jgi:SSS family solute:Na+ symporter